MEMSGDICLGLTSTFESLDCKSSKIATIKANSFSGLNHVQRLNMESGKVNTIAAHAFQGLTDLRVLFFSGNEIENILKLLDLVANFLESNPR